MIEIDQEICRNLESALSREWLETNGIGGFSSSTITGLNTRRYHGLLTAATKPPVGRLVLLSKLEETLTIDGRRYELSANQYPGVVHPQGFKYQTGFRLDPFPVLRPQRVERPPPEHQPRNTAAREPINSAAWACAIDFNLLSSFAPRNKPVKVARP